MPLDKRINAYRPDLADESLRNNVTAAHYAEPVMRQCLRGVLPVLSTPDDNAEQISQIRYGEFADIFETREDGFIWAQNRSDRYVGYIPHVEADWGEHISMLSNRVTALRTFLYPEPNVRTPPLDELTLGSYVSIEKENDKFLELSDGGFIIAKHVMATEFAHTQDYVFTAGRLLHTPYLWGGRTPKGIDCSGLVQLVLEMAGIGDVPRDSDLQREAYGEELPCHWRDYGWKRGDLVFFPGHIGIMTGTDHIIHADGHIMEVTVEPLAHIVARGNEVLAVGNASRLKA